MSQGLPWHLSLGLIRIFERNSYRTGHYATAVPTTSAMQKLLGHRQLRVETACAAKGEISNVRKTLVRLPGSLLRLSIALDMLHAKHSAAQETREETEATESFRFHPRDSFRTPAHRRRPGDVLGSAPGS